VASPFLELGEERGRSVDWLVAIEQFHSCLACDCLQFGVAVLFQGAERLVNRAFIGVA
jgi:hypothetical protein